MDEVGDGSGSKLDDVKAEHLQTVHQYWKRFDLDGRRHKLDQQALDMRARHEATLSSRKQLAVATKAFNAKDSAGKQSSMPALLRQYREEIDSLTRRARHAERAFRDLYRPLCEGPDPVTSLTTAVDSTRRAAEAEARCAALQHEVAEFEAEFAKLKNQDITIRQLEERLRGFEDDVERQVAKRLEERERELRAAVEEEAEAGRTQQAEAQRAVEAAQDEVVAAQRLADATQTQLLELRTKYDEDTAAFRAEIDVLAQESDRANQRVLGLTRQLEAAQADGSDDDTRPRHDLSSHVETTKRLLEAEAEAAKQRAAVRDLSKQWEATLADQAQQHEASMGALTAELAERQRDLEALRGELEARPSVEDVLNLRRKLRALEALHFNVEVEDDGEAGEAGLDGDMDGDVDVRSAIMKRVRQLERSAVTLRRERDEARVEAEASKKEAGQAQARLSEQQDLVERLENDLADRTARTPARNAPGRSSQGATSSDAARLQMVLNGSGSIPGLGGSSAAGGREAELGAAESGAAGGGGGAAGSGSGAGSGPGGGSDASASLRDPHSVVEILRGQRDRFRSKVVELERQCQKLRSDVAKGRTRAAKLTRDNVKLYEKVRYLESYARGDGGKAAEGTGGSGGMGDVETGGTGSGARRRGAGAADDFEAPYSRMYEENVNPFTVFNRREKERRYRNLTAAEKITLSSSRFFLSNKYARNFIFFYSLALHLLVFSTLFHFVHVNHRSCK